MQISLKPQVQSIAINRECPSGKIRISANLGFHTPKGMCVATKSIGGYDGLKVEFSDETLKAASAFIDALLSDVEECLQQELRENLEV